MPDQFAQAHALAGAHDVRRLVRQAGLRQAHRPDLGPVAAERRLPQHERLGGRAQLLGIAPEHQQQLHRRVARQGRYGDGGRLHLRQVQVRGALVVGRQHDGMPVGDGIEKRGEARAAIAGRGAEPRGQHTRRTHDRQRWLLREHEGQLEAPVVAQVEERRRQQRQVAALYQRPRDQLERALVADAGPKTGMEREFAVHRVVPEELEMQLGEFDEVARIQIDVHGLRRPQAIARQADAGKRLLVDHDLQLRQVGQQCRREGEVQVQARAHHRLVEAHGQRQIGAAVDATQLQRMVGTQLAQRDRAGAQPRRGPGQQSRRKRRRRPPGGTRHLHGRGARRRRCDGRGTQQRQAAEQRARACRTGGAAQPLQVVEQGVQPADRGPAAPGRRDRVVPLHRRLPGGPAARPACTRAMRTPRRCRCNGCRTALTANY